MSSGTRLLTAACLGMMFLFAAGSCSLGPQKNRDSMLRAMNLDQTTFSQMRVCQQVRGYTDVGAQFFDLDHDVALVPAWMDDALAGAVPTEVAACIGDEGNYRLGLFAAQLASRLDTSLAVRTLASLAHRLEIMTNPDLQGFLETAICDYELDYSAGLTQTYYLGKYGITPTYLSAPYDAVKMRAQLCRN